MKFKLFYSIAIINVILQSYFWWLMWLMNVKLPENLGSEMSAEVILSKYSVICARFEVWMAFSVIVLVILVNIFLIGVYYIFKNAISKEN